MSGNADWWAKLGCILIFGKAFPTVCRAWKPGKARPCSRQTGPYRGQEERQTVVSPDVLHSDSGHTKTGATLRHWPTWQEVREGAKISQIRMPDKANNITVTAVEERNFRFQ